MMFPNGMLYQVLLLFEGKGGLVMTCGEQFTMLNEMQSSCKELLFLCAL